MTHFSFWFDAALEQVVHAHLCLQWAIYNNRRAPPVHKLTEVGYCQMEPVSIHTLCCVRTQSATCVASACCRVSRSFFVLAWTSLFRRVARPLLDEREGGPIPCCLRASTPPLGDILSMIPPGRQSMGAMSRPVYHRTSTCRTSPVIERRTSHRMSKAHFSPAKKHETVGGK